MEKILEVNNLTKKYGEIEAVKNLSFSLKKGEVIALIGSNGSGKTTASEMIAGIVKPTSGTIKYNYEYKSSFKEFIGMQFQDSVYPSGLKVKDLVIFARNLRKIKIPRKDLKKLIKTFGLGNIYNEKVSSLSGGQKQKINIFMSIIHNPKIVILDELTTGLDVASREEIIKFTKELLKKNNISAILISHHMREIEALADKVVVLANGEKILEATPKEINKKYGSLDKYMINMINSTPSRQKDGMDASDDIYLEGDNRFEIFIQKIYKYFLKKKDSKKGNKNESEF